MCNFDGRYSDVHLIALTGVRGKRKKKEGGQSNDLYDFDGRYSDLHLIAQRKLREKENG